MFDHDWMSTVQQLQARIAGMQDAVPRLPVPTHPAFAHLVQLRTGAAYEVDRATLGMILLATPSQEGTWSAVVGADDFGIEAAAELGLDLTRTVLVPDPGEHWLEATAALVDVVPLVLLRPPPGVTERTASRIAARLRKRSATLVVWGRWPGAEARFSIETSAWAGVDQGHGRLRSRQLLVGVQRGSAPMMKVALQFPEGDALRQTEDVVEAS
jgi:hypothetical protein